MSVIGKPKCIFINRYQVHITQRASVGFNTLKVRGRLTTRKNYNCNANQPLLCIMRIRTHYFAI